MLRNKAAEVVRSYVGTHFDLVITQETAKIKVAVELKLTDAPPSPTSGSLAALREKLRAGLVAAISMTTAYLSVLPLLVY